MRTNLCASLLLAIGMNAALLAQTPTSFKFVSINYPNSVSTSANGINNYGSSAAPTRRVPAVCTVSS